MVVTGGVLVWGLALERDRSVDFRGKEQVKVGLIYPSCLLYQAKVSYHHYPRYVKLLVPLGARLFYDNKCPINCIARVKPLRLGAVVQVR